LDKAQYYGCPSQTSIEYASGIEVIDGDRKMKEMKTRMNDDGRFINKSTEMKHISPQ